jgi:hypothetical protein
MEAEIPAGRGRLILYSLLEFIRQILRSRRGIKATDEQDTRHNFLYYAIAREKDLKKNRPDVVVWVET